MAWSKGAPSSWRRRLRIAQRHASAFNLHRAWDRAFLPKPFARVQIEWRGPMGPLARTDDPRHPLVLGQLEHLMLQAKRDARVPGQQVVPDMVPLPEHTAL